MRGILQSVDTEEMGVIIALAREKVAPDDPAPKPIHEWFSSRKTTCMTASDVDLFEARRTRAEEQGQMLEISEAGRGGGTASRNLAWPATRRRQEELTSSGGAVGHGISSAERATVRRGARQRGDVHDEAEQQKVHGGAAAQRRADDARDREARHVGARGRGARPARCRMTWTRDIRPSAPGNRAGGVAARIEPAPAPRRTRRTRRTRRACRAAAAAPAAPAAPATPVASTAPKMPPPPPPPPRSRPSRRRRRSSSRASANRSRRRHPPRPHRHGAPHTAHRNSR